MAGLSFDPIATILGIDAVSDCIEIDAPKYLQCKVGQGKILQVNANYEGEDREILVKIPSVFPHIFPLIYLSNASSYSAFGHLDWFGNICYKDSEGVVYDYRQPEMLLQALILEAFDTLHTHSNDESLLDLQLEFEAYLESMSPESIDTMMFVEPQEGFSVLTAYIDHKNERKTDSPSYYAIVEDTAQIKTLYHPLKMLKDKKQSKIPYLPLNSFPGLPSPLKKWTLDDVFNLIKNHSKPTDFDAFTIWMGQQNWSALTGVVLSHSKPGGEIAYWGLRFNRKNKAQYPLLKTSVDWEISPITLHNQSKSYLTQRAGGDVALRDKHVMVIGCGSIGGHIANNLAKCGIGELTLVDKDTLHGDNIHRHILGGSWVLPNKKLTKTNALWIEIEGNIPNIRVNPESKYLHEVIKREKIVQYDLLIVATGDFPDELMLNLFQHENNIETPIIYTWQDGFGVGGHVMQVGSPTEAGCLECLYTRSSGFKPHTKTSFIKQGQTITRHLGGCTGVFTPYSYVDALQTATLATRAALQVLGGDKSNVFYSWKGSDEDLKKNGYQASSWYYKLEDAQHLDETSYIASNCKVCGSNSSIC